MTARKKARQSNGDPGIFNKVSRSRFYREFKHDHGHDHGHGNENVKKNRFHSGTTTTLPVSHSFWYISLVFSARLGRDIKAMLGSLKCDDGDGNENVKKAIRLD